MAYVSFNQAAEQSFNGTNSGPQVGFFVLKNDGDEALVRFMYESADQFQLVTVHNEEVGDKIRKINCIREPHEPIDKCPLCRKGGNTTTRFFIHLLEYKRDENGNIYCEPKVWERSFSYANQLKSLIDEYGPLTQNLFKVKRNGAAGSQDTTYSIMYAAPQVYKPELYPNHPELFEGYNVIGTLVMDKTAEELDYFVQNRVFPQKQSTGQQTNAAVNSNPVPQTPVAQPTVSNNTQQPQQQRQTAWGNNVSNNTGFTNPSRYY